MKLAAYDPFTRTASDLGTADKGGAWWESSASLTTDGSRAVSTHTAQNHTRYAVLDDIEYMNARVRAKFRTDKVPSGAAQSWFLAARATENTGMYGWAARATVNTAGDIDLSIERWASTGTFVSNTGGANVIASVAANTDYWIEIEVTKSPSTVKARMWADGDAVPAWQITVTGDASGPVTKNGFAFRFQNSTSTNLTNVFNVDDLQAFDLSTRGLKHNVLRFAGFM